MSSSRELSRRDFLGAAAGLMACARGSQGSVQHDSSQRSDALLYVGTSTQSGSSQNGVHLVRVDLRSGELRTVGSMDAGPNPSFLVVNPNSRALYAVNEVETLNGKASGGVSAFTIANDTGVLTRANEQPSGGSGPCFVSTDRSGQVVLVANYDAGSVALLPIQSDASLAPATQVIRHTGRGPNIERQAAPHAHCILADPSNRFALAADLGADRVFVYRLDLERKSLSHVEGADAVMRPGAGPRHLVFHPSLPLVFVANELNSTVAILGFDKQSGKLSPLDVLSTVAADWKGANYPADIHIAASGRALYVSNRGHNSIAVFAVAESGALALDQVISTEGDWPRNFTLDPSDRWLLVANQRSNSIVVFSRDQSTGRLTPTRQRIELPSPVCLRFR